MIPGRVQVITALWIVIAVSVLAVAALVHAAPIRGPISLDANAMDYLLHGPTFAPITRFVLSNGWGAPLPWCKPGEAHEFKPPIGLACPVRPPWAWGRGLHPTAVLMPIETPLLSAFAVSRPPVSTETPRRNIAIPDVAGVARAALARFIGFFAGDAAATCNVPGGACFWIGGTGTSGITTWSSTSPGLSCGCIPTTTSTVTFDANSGTGTASLAGNTVWGSMTISSSNMAVDTTASNFSLTLPSLSISAGSLVTRASAVTINGSVSVSGAGGFITSSASGSWTVAASWSNVSTSASWSFAAPITFNSSASQTMTFDGANVTEFSGAVSITNTAGSGTVTYTMAGAFKSTGAVNLDGTASAGTILTTSASNFAFTAGTRFVIDGTNDNFVCGFLANGSTVAINGGVVIGQANGFLDLGSSSWTVANTTDNGDWAWYSVSTSASWNAGTSTVTVNGLPPTGGGVQGSGTSSDPFYNLTLAGAFTYLSGRALYINNNFTVSFPAVFTDNAVVKSYPSCGVCGATNGDVHAGNVTISGTLNSYSTVTVTGNLTAGAGDIVNFTGGFTFAGNAGASLSLSTVHAVNVLGNDLGNIGVTGTTTVEFQSSFASESFSSTQSVLLAMDSGITWTYNGGGALGSSSPPLYVELDTGGQLCQTGFWTFQTTQAIRANQVVVCGSIASSYPVYDLSGVNLGNNQNWIFSGNAGGYGLISITCTPRYNFLSYLISCATNITDPGLLPNQKWFLDQRYVASGAVGILPVPDTELGPKSVTVQVAFAWTGFLASQSLTLDGQPNLLLLILGGVLALILVSVAREGRTPKRQRLIHNENHRRLAVKVSPWPEGSGNPRWLSYRQRSPDAFSRIRTLRRGHSEKWGRVVWVLGGPLRSTGRVEVQTVRERAKRGEKVVDDHFERVTH